MSHIRISRSICFVVSLVLLFMVVTVGFADVRLPAVIGNNMVLQQSRQVPVWGWAQPGEKIEVVFADNSPVKTTADKTGRWMVKVQTPVAGGPYEMTIRGKNIIFIKDILVGEVWVCAGQSNMEMPLLCRGKWFNGVLNWDKEIAAANYPKIRLFNIKKTTANKPQQDCIGWWTPCSAATAADFSAAAYFFGRELHKQLNVPIGLIHTSVGGSPAEAWMKQQILQSDPDFAPVLKWFADAVANYPQAIKEYRQKLKEWKKSVEQAQAEGKKPPEEPFPPLGPGHYFTPSGLYNAMLAPLMPYSVQGVIWNQGEGNAARPYQYRKLFPAMIKNWRDDWGQGDFPFYYVQIAPFNYKWSRPMFAPELREAQLMTLSVPNTGMVVTMDIGDFNDIHPRNKQEVGRRLALWALAKTYGRNNIVYSGPIYKSMKVDGNKIRLYFDHIGSGLMAKGGDLTDFTIAGEDKNFAEAKALIDGDTIVVSSDKVEKPVAVRYAWSNSAVPNLFNKENLPASPFRTDDWPNIAASEK